MPSAPKDKQVNIRIPASTEAMMRRNAQYRGRTPPEEWRLAVDYWIHRSALALLEDPEVQEHYGPARLVQERERITQAMSEMEARAFERPSPTDLLAESALT